MRKFTFLITGSLLLFAITGCTTVKRFKTADYKGADNSLVDVEFLNFHVREELNRSAQRRMAVLNPLKLTITNWPEGKIDTFIAENNPGDTDERSREIEFSGEL